MANTKTSTTSSDKRTILSSSGALLGLRIGGQAVTFALGVVLARALGPTEFGLYTLVLAIVTLLMVPAQFGLPSLMTREVAQAREDEARIGMVMRWGQKWTFWAAGSVFLLGAAGLFAMQGMVNGMSPLMVALAFLNVPILSYIFFNSAVLRGLKRPSASQFPEQVFRPFVLLVMVGVVWLTMGQSPLTANTALVLNVLAAFLALVLARWLTVRSLPAGTRLGQGAALPDEITRRAWTRAIIPLALSSGIQSLNTQIDILSLGIFSSPEEVGIYRVASRGAFLVYFVLLSVGMVASPYFARYKQDGRMGELQGLVTLAGRAVFAASAIPAAALIFYGEPIISFVFGAEYAAAAGPLAVLCIGQLFNAATGPIIQLLNMTGNERAVARGVTIGAVVNVALNLVLVPVYGPVGASIATAVSVAVWNLYLWISCRRTLGIDSSFIGLGARSGLS